MLAKAGFGLTRLLDARFWRNSISPSARIHQAELEGECLINPRAVITGRVKIGAHSLIGEGCTIAGGQVSIGRFSQFGPYAAVYAVNHNYKLAASYTGPGIARGALRQHVLEAPVDIGHDVWVGHGTVVLPGVTIGTGAVIGAASVVTKSVPCYAVVVGNPCRLVKYRFSPEIVDALLASCWWDQPIDVLSRHVKWFCMPAEDLGRRLESPPWLGTAQNHERSRSARWP
jgi:virginiamycin A acetyltransferase